MLPAKVVHPRMHLIRIEVHTKSFDLAIEGSSIRACSVARVQAKRVPALRDALNEANDRRAFQLVVSVVPSVGDTDQEVESCQASATFRLRHQQVECVESITRVKIRSASRPSPRGIRS